MEALYNFGKFGFITGLVVGTVCFSTVTYGQSVAEQRVCRQGGQYAVFAQHPLFRGAWQIPDSRGPIGDATNTEFSHEHIFFCNNSSC